MNTRRRLARLVDTRRSRHLLVALGLGAFALSATLTVAAPTPLPRGTVSVELMGTTAPRPAVQIATLASSAAALARC